MTCVKCKVRQIECLGYYGIIYQASRFAFCLACRDKYFPHDHMPSRQYIRYWLLKSKPYLK